VAFVAGCDELLEVVGAAVGPNDENDRRTGEIRRLSAAARKRLRCREEKHIAAYLLSLI
jgi:hypothetical protein